MTVVAQPRGLLTLLPRETYVAQAICEREVERIFMRQWTFTAHESQLPKPGDFVVEDVAGESIVVVRDDVAISTPSSTCAAIAAVSSASRRAVP